MTAPSLANLFDFDAVSLYPSAMYRLYLQTGKPISFQDKSILFNKFLELTCNENEQPTKDKPFSSFIVDVQITKINKHRHFPLIVYREKKTHTNCNDDKCELPMIMTLII